MSKTGPSRDKRNPGQRLDLHRRLSDAASGVAEEVFTSLNTPFSLGLALCLKHKDFQSLINADLDYKRYDDIDDFRCDYLAKNLMSKFPHFDLGVDLLGVAIVKFLDSEKRCSEARDRLQLLRRGRIKFSDPVFSVVPTARQKIAKLLGTFNWDQAEQYFGFGPGACIGLRSTFGDSYYKFGQNEPTTTAGNVDLAALSILRVPAWLNGQASTIHGPDPWKRLKIVPGNNVTTVPKSAKTDRVIAIEPMMNMYVQKGIGGVIRRKLRKVGVNLDSQTLNQTLAQAGSLDGSLATIDLSSASDCVSLALVEDLLPEDWVTAIKLCRSPLGTLPDGNEIRYQKVSSMGNGYTFELESLIFWALTSSVMSFLNESDPRFAIYGDDIIVPSQCAETLIHVLGFVGFKTNVDKTFVDGPFRESCGKHYFKGVDVSPIYIKDHVDSIETVLILANNVRRLAHRMMGSSWGCDSRLERCWRKLVQLLPPLLRKPRIPFQSLHRAVGDGALVGNFDECCPRRAPRGFEGYSVNVVSRRYSTISPDGVARLLRSLVNQERISGNFLDHCGRIAEFTPVEGRDKIPTSRYKLRFIKTTVARWEDLGPWI
jgi:hypothetical protein